MKTEQWLEQVLRDDDARAAFERYLQCQEAHMKDHMQRTRVCLVVVVIGVVAAFLLGGVKGFIPAIVIGCVCMFCCEFLPSRSGDMEAAAWECSGLQIARGAVKVFFDGVLTTEKQQLSDVLTRVVRADRTNSTQQFSGVWKGVSFRACNMCMMEDYSEEPSHMLFDGLLLEIAVDPGLEQWMKAQWGVEVQYKYVKRKLPKLTQDQAILAQQVFRRDWLRQLAEVACIPSVMVGMITRGGKRILQVGLASLHCVYSELKLGGYERFVKEVAANLSTIQQLMDVIVSNRRLFGEQE